MTSIKERLAAGQRVVGILSPSNDVAQAELLARLGWDFILMDAEHGPIDPDRLHGLVRAIAAGGALPMVRTPGQDRHVVTRYLESGALGLMAPMVESRSQAAALAAACRYPPLGHRGIAASPATGFGLTGFPSMLANLDEQMLVVAQIETAAGLSCASDIAATPGIDVIFVGAMDLSASLGHPADFEHPKVRAAISKVSAAAADAGKPLGMLVTHPKQFELANQLGATFVAVYLDAILAVGSRAFKSAAEDRVVHK